MKKKPTKATGEKIEFVITKAVQKKLDDLCKYYGATESEVITKLIRDERIRQDGKE